MIGSSVERTPSSSKPFEFAVLAGLCATVIAACGSESAPAVTYYADVKPIVDGRCIECHHAGGIAPFPLKTYDNVAAVTGPMRAAVAERRMPPWPAAEGCRDYSGDRSLTDAQIHTLLTWIDEGSPEGDASHAGAAIPAVAETGLSRVDLTLGMPVDYVSTVEPDEYRCFILDWPYSDTRYITGLAAKPGNAKIVHHANLYLVGPQYASIVDGLDVADPGPGYSCLGSGPNVTADFLGGYVPGQLDGTDFPEGTGLPIAPGSRLVLQVHYHSQGAGTGPDRTSVDFRLESKVAHEGGMVFWADMNWLKGDGMLIPAGQKNVVHKYCDDPLALNGGMPFVLASASLHMHTLGTRGKLWLERQDGSTVCLANVPKWEFEWQLIYWLREYETLKAGDRLCVECAWDNSAENQAVIAGRKQPTHDVTWGWGTGDEMCAGMLYAYVP